MRFLERRGELPVAEIDREALFRTSSEYDCDFADVKGQEHAKRALEVAAREIRDGARVGGDPIPLAGPAAEGVSTAPGRVGRQ